MKKALFFVIPLLIGFGCAKQQIVKPTPAPVPAAPEVKPVVKSNEEPSVRYADWTQVPQLQSVRFDYDKFELTVEDRDTLKKNADYIINSSTDIAVLVEGHCDERGTIQYNLALGQKRAAAVREYYGQLGVDLARISTISYGNEKPVVQRRGPRC